MTSSKNSIEYFMKTSDVRFGTSGLRGLVDQMSDELCYAYVTAFLQAVVANENVDNRVVLGHDLRPSSPRIAAACAKAIMDSGREVIYAGELPTPALASYAYEHQLPAIVVTGSHIPFDRNGIKFYCANGEISKADEVAIQQAEVVLPNSLMVAQLPELDKRVEAYYIKRYVDFFGANCLSGLRIASYEHSGVARDLLRTILEALGAEVITLGRTDSFVPIDTEAVRAEDIVQAQAWARDYKFDAILSTDGDADRPLIGDELGQWLRGDVLGVLCAKFLGADVVATPVSSSTVTEKSGWFKQVLRTRIGSPYVIAAMEQEINSVSTVVGFEANGGFLLGSDIIKDGRQLSALPTRDAVLPMLAALCFAQDSNCAMSQLSAILPNRFTASDRLQSFPTEQSKNLLHILEQDSQQASQLMAAQSGSMISIDITDGFRVTFSNGDIVHLRPSGNAPELRCYAESDTQTRAQQLCDDCLGNVSSYLT